MHPQNELNVFRNHLSRRFVARISSTLIVASLVVFRPFSKLGSHYAFLALTIHELVFSAQTTLAQQLEATVLHLSGGLLGIGLSALGKYLASLTSVGSLESRIIPALFLTLMALLAGFVKSRLTRLTMAMRIMLFIGIWLLTADVGLTQHFSRDCGAFVWIVLTAAACPLFTSLLLLRWSSPQIAIDIATAFSELHVSLQKSLGNAFGIPMSLAEHQNIQKSLLERSVDLNACYQRAAFELRLGRVGVKSIKPFIGTVENCRRELAVLPIDCPCDVSDETVQAFKAPAMELGSAILDSLVAIENGVLRCYENALRRLPLREEKDALSRAKARVETTQAHARRELSRMCSSLDLAKSSSESEPFGFPKRLFDLCLLMISLLQLGREIHHALRVAIDVHATYHTTSATLFHPKWSLAWLGASAGVFVMEERGTFLPLIDSRQSNSTSSLHETLQGLAEQQEEVEAFREDVMREKGMEHGASKRRRLAGRPFSIFHLRSRIRLLWNESTTIRVRLAISRMVRTVQHSPHLKHALKNAAGVAALSVPAFLPASNPHRQTYEWIRGQWMLISFVWVLETNTGSTWRVGYLRLSGTLIGATYAYAVSLICRLNPFLIVLFVVLADFPISWIIINTDFPSLGVVASVTLPPIILSQYIHFDPTVSTLQLGALRAAMISAGIVAALALNSLFFPRHARVQFLETGCLSLAYLNQLYIRLSRDLFHAVSTSALKEKRKTLKLELDIRNALNRMDILLATMHDELSLVPKPMRKYRQLVSVLQKLLDIMVGIRKIRDHIPRRETVIEVLPERRELVSCVCISLFACEQVFRARQPLPQFLPSVRRAFRILEHAIEERIRQSGSDLGALGLPLIYSLAETDALMAMVDSIEEVLDIARDLFGTATWYRTNSLPVSQLTTVMSDQDDSNSERQPPSPSATMSLFFDNSGGDYFSPH